jgi:hypothetical protein
MSDQPVTIARFRTRLDAEIAGGLLKAAGIPFLVQSPEGMGLGPLSQGTSLLVRQDQAVRARRLLEEAGVVGDPE